MALSLLAPDLYQVKAAYLRVPFIAWITETRDKGVVLYYFFNFQIGAAVTYKVKSPAGTQKETNSKGLLKTAKAVFKNTEEPAESSTQQTDQTKNRVYGDNFYMDDSDNPYS